MTQSRASSTRTAAGLALLTMLFAGPLAAGDHLGRLFLTPEQRLALDLQRDAESPDKTMVGQSPISQTTNRRVLLNGVVRRNHGPNVVWLNGQLATDNNHQSVQLRGEPDADNRVTMMKTDGLKVRLKPGQVWDPLTGQISECFGCQTNIVVPAAIADEPATDP